MKKHAWMLNPELLKKIVYASCNGMTDKEISKVYELPASTISSWLSNHKISVIIGKAGWKILKKARSLRYRFGVPILKIINDKGVPVKRFSRTGKYPNAWYRPIKKKDSPTFKGWESTSFEAIINALIQSAGFRYVRGILQYNISCIHIRFLTKRPTDQDLLFWLSGIKKAIINASVTNELFITKESIQIENPTDLDTEIQSKIIARKEMLSKRIRLSKELRINESLALSEKELKLNKIALSMKELYEQIIIRKADGPRFLKLIEIHQRYMHMRIGWAAPTLDKTKLYKSIYPEFYGNSNQLSLAFANISSLVTNRYIRIDWISNGYEVARAANIDSNGKIVSLISYRVLERNAVALSDQEIEIAEELRQKEYVTLKKLGYRSIAPFRCENPKL